MIRQDPSVISATSSDDKGTRLCRSPRLGKKIWQKLTPGRFSKIKSLAKNGIECDTIRIPLLRQKEEVILLSNYS